MTDDFVQWIKDKCEDKEITEVRVTRGKKHDHLGVNLDCTKPGKVKVDVIDCTVKMAEDFPCQKELGTNEIQTPAAKHLLQTR